MKTNRYHFTKGLPFMLEEIDLWLWLSFPNTVGIKRYDLGALLLTFPVASLLRLLFAVRPEERALFVRGQCEALPHLSPPKRLGVHLAQTHLPLAASPHWTLHRSVSAALHSSYFRTIILFIIHLLSINIIICEYYYWALIWCHLGASEGDE